jgi:flagellar export protein FliJ
MGFHFTLETVLRLRRSLEDRERLRLQSLHFQRTELELQIDAAALVQKRLRAGLNSDMNKAAICGAELQFTIQRVRACESRAGRLRALTAGLDQQIAKQQVLVLERRRQRRVLEQLRDQQWSRYQSDTEHRAQAQIDELFLLRRFGGAEQRRTSAI